jgi:hypothetical protein
MGSEEENLAATPQRVRAIATTLRNHDAQARVGTVTESGPLQPGPVDAAVIVGSLVVEIPSNGRIRQRVRDAQPGTEILLDLAPPEQDIWLWVACDASRQCNELFEMLSGL